MYDHLTSEELISEFREQPLSELERELLTRLDESVAAEQHREDELNDCVGMGHPDGRHT